MSSGWIPSCRIRLAELGRLAEALTADQEAVALRRELPAASPDRYLPELADSLNSLGVRFSALGRPAETAAAHDEAMKACARPDR